MPQKRARGVEKEQEEEEDVAQADDHEPLEQQLEEENDSACTRDVKPDTYVHSQNISGNEASTSAFDPSE
jgi:hypothetical protein